MAKVIISNELENEINKKFKGSAIEIFNLLLSLEENPKKGRIVGNIGGTIINELKYKSFRFYFITDGYLLRVLNTEELHNLIIKFVRMSDKKTQQKVIDEIKNILRKIGEEGF